MSTVNENKLEASFSMLVMSIASSAAINLGLSPDPSSGTNEVNKPMAQFHIDLLLVLKEKTKNQLTNEESRLLESLIGDLQLKFVNI